MSTRPPAARAESPLFRGVHYGLDVAKVTVDGLLDRPGSAAAVFSALADAGIRVADCHTTPASDGRRDLAFLVPADAGTDTAEALDKALPAAEFRTVRCDFNVARVVLVGSGLSLGGRTITRFMEVLLGTGITAQLLSVTDTRVTALTHERDARRAATALCRGFGAADRPAPATEPSEAAAG